jgi:hypothetical protein
MTESDRRRRFDALFAAHGPDIVAYCRWRAGSASDAQDAAADVFLTAWRRFDRCRRAMRPACGSTQPRGRSSPTNAGRGGGAPRSRNGWRASGRPLRLGSRSTTRPRSSARRYVGSGPATARCCSSPSRRACRRPRSATSWAALRSPRGAGSTARGGGSGPCSRSCARPVAPSVEGVSCLRKRNPTCLRASRPCARPTHAPTRGSATRSRRSREPWAHASSPTPTRYASTG